MFEIIIVKHNLTTIFISVHVNIHPFLLTPTAYLSKFVKTFFHLTNRRIIEQFEVAITKLRVPVLQANFVYDVTMVSRPKRAVVTILV